MFEIVTFGSAIWDIFIRDKAFHLEKNSRFFSGKDVCFPLGSKIDIDEIHFFSGGGGTNSAATFSSQGIKTAYCGMVGFDLGGDEITKDLKQFKVNTDLISRTDKKATNHSFVLSIPGKDRTILVYRGASEFMSLKDIFWNRIKKNISKKGWFYLAPLSGNLSQFFEKIVDFAYKNKIKIAINPGNSQLEMPKNKIKKILEKIDILILNQEEAALLTDIPYKKEKEIFKKIRSFYSGILAITNGAKGAIVSDSTNVYRVGILNSKVIDRTGAGDAFAAGFVSGIIKTNNIEHSIQLASANATSCLKKWGAKNGLLCKNEIFKKIRVVKSKFH